MNTTWSSQIKLGESGYLMLMEANNTVLVWPSKALGWRFVGLVRESESDGRRSLPVGSTRSSKPSAH